MCQPPATRLHSCWSRGGKACARGDLLLGAGGPGWPGWLVLLAWLAGLAGPAWVLLPIRRVPRWRPGLARDSMRRPTKRRV